jgi:hypothetical protein
VPKRAKNHHQLHVVEGVLVNGQPFGYVESKPCSICTHEQHRPGWSIYEPDVECSHRRAS